MKNLFKICLTVICFLFTFQLLAQLSSDLATETATPKKKQNSNKIYFLATESFPLESDGRQFLNSEFVEGLIIDFENESIDIPVRYRFADDEMQISHLNKVKAIYPSKIKQIIFKNGDQIKVFIPAEYLVKKVKNYGYFELISKGKISLLKAYRKSGKDGVKTKVFYLESGENKLATPVSKKKSKILSVFGDKKSEMAKYVAKYSLNLKDCEDLAKVFNYYNSKYMK